MALRSLCRTGMLLCLGLFTLSFAYLPAQVQQPAGAATFTNPLLSVGPDPWVIEYKGTYYYTNTTGFNLTLWATKDITDLQAARKKIVWTPPTSGPYSHELWAPELHRFDGRWYLYFSADQGDNTTHRIFALENTSDDPLDGAWTFKGQLKAATDKWAIDGSAFEVDGKKYLIWSGWKGDTNGEQDIFIARLANPWTIGSERTLLSSPRYPWEEAGDLPKDDAMPHLNVNEGPEILLHGDDVFLVYSASACWTDNYSLGVLRAKRGSNLLDAASWTKYDHPFLRKSAAAGAFGTGHNGFFKSPDGKQDWIIYHANPKAGQGCGNQRSPRAQPFTWNADGTPNFGQPASIGVPLLKPSR